MAHRARVALAGCGGAPAGAARRRGGAGGRCRPAARSAAAARAAPAPPRSSGGGCQPSSTLDHGVEVVDLDLARDVGAAEAELPGRPQRVGEGRGRADAERRPVACRRVQARAVPAAQPRRDVTGEPARARCETGRCGASERLEQGHYVGSAIAFRLWRARSTRTTSHTSPSLLERADHRGREVDLPATQAVRRGGRERVVVVVPRLARAREAPATARLRDSSPVSNRCRPKKWHSELML